MSSIAAEVTKSSLHKRMHPVVRRDYAGSVVAYHDHGVIFSFVGGVCLEEVQPPYFVSVKREPVQHLAQISCLGLTVTHSAHETP